ncbi:acyl-CoA thioesterase domain-containing protein [Nonomuraea sp. NPDC048916]|uniref:acyl-CoA thioesterase domain-containing protein n=1 Tax=Nonomuraea sp. NPDC048916 TaxID=3154232 RepID=UPI0033ECD858
MSASAWPRGDLDPGSGVTVGAEICAHGRLFGGWGLGLLAEVAQRSTGRRLGDLSVSYLRPVAEGSRLEVACEPLAVGRSLGHYRLDATDGGLTALAGTAVVGPGPGPVEHTGRPPRVPPPGDCPERPYMSGPGAGTAVLLDVRSARDEMGAGVAGSALLWARVRCDLADEVRLAVVSDHVPYLLRRAFPELARVATVGASLRVLGGPVAEWVLLDVSLVACAGRTAVGRVVMWSGGTTLAGVAEQTARLTPG